MSLRIAFDMDGVLADFESAFREIERRMYGEDVPPPPELPEARAEEEERGWSRVSIENAEGASHTSSGEPPRRRATDHPDAGPAAIANARRDSGDTPKRRASDLPGEAPDVSAEAQPLPARRKLDKVWAAIEETPGFWSSLAPIDPGAVKRIHKMMLLHGWEVFFITQRPRTAGESVQRQTQRWLVAQGFEWPSVLVMPGSRGKAAAALHLDFLIDDSAKNCVDVLADSKARPILILREPDRRTDNSARRLGIGVVDSIAAALDILEKATERRAKPSLLSKLTKLVGWRT
jgi:hypothetical protein